MELLEILKISGVMVLGCLVQSSAGFGFGLFALPILLFLGFDLPQSVMIVVTGSAIQKITAVTYLRKDVDWKGLLPYMLTGLAALPLGVYLMYRVSFLSQPQAKQIIGFCILALVLLQWRRVHTPGNGVHPGWGYLAGFFSGVLNGLANIGGPPLVFWILAHGWSNEKMRVTALAFSLVFVPFQVGLMVLGFGVPILDSLWKTILLTPVILLGSWLGLRIGAAFSRENLRLYMRFLLIIIAVSALLGPLLSSTG